MKSAYKKIVIFNTLLLAGATAVILANNSSKALVSNGETSTEHGEDCVWEHYSAKEATAFENGSKEYWVCCKHHSHQFVAPVEGSIRDVKAPKAEFVSSLDYTDDRYDPAKADVICDAASVEYSAIAYPMASGTFTRKSDAAIGNYYEVSGITNTNDAVWVGPQSMKEMNLSIYSKMYVYVKCSLVGSTLNVRKADYSSIKNFTIADNEWQLVEFDTVSDTFVGISHWTQHADPFTLCISSFYGVRKSSFHVFDTSVNVFRGTNSEEPTYKFLASHQGNGVATANNSDESFVPHYSSVSGINRSGDQINISTEVNIDLSAFTAVYFFVRANQPSSSLGQGFKLRKRIYDDVKSYTVAANQWQLVVFNQVSDACGNDLSYYGIGSWGDYTDVQFDFSDVYGVTENAPENLYNAATDYWIDFDSVADVGTPNHTDDAFVKPYSTITGITRAGGQEKFRPGHSKDVSSYSKIFFWVRANQDVTNMFVLSSTNGWDETKYVTKIDLPKDTWKLVVADVAALGIDDVKNVVFGKWGTFNGLALDFGSVYGA